MALPASRTQLKEWALRKLGHPVIRINIDPSQMDDRICEALDYFHQYHYEGIERLYLNHRITASTMTFTAPLATIFQKREIIEGQSSGARGRFIRQSTDDTFIEFTTIEGEFTENETVTGLITGTTGIIDSIEIGDIDNGFIPLPDSVVAVRKVLKIQSSGDYLFDIRFHYALNTIPALLGFDLIGFDMLNKHLALLDHLLNPEPSMSFNRLTGRLYLNIDWAKDIQPGDLIVLEAEVIVNPENFLKVYGNEWVRNYTAALFKQQWAQNIGKYAGVQLPGGITLDAESIKREAAEEIAKLLEELQSKFQVPPKMIVG